MPYFWGKLECEVFVGFIGLETNLWKFILIGRLRQGALQTNQIFLKKSINLSTCIHTVNIKKTNKFN